MHSFSLNIPVHYWTDTQSKIQRDPFRLPCSTSGSLRQLLVHQHRLCMHRLFPPAWAHGTTVDGKSSRVQHWQLQRIMHPPHSPPSILISVVTTRQKQPPSPLQVLLHTSFKETVYLRRSQCQQSVPIPSSQHLPLNLRFPQLCFLLPPHLAAHS